MNHYIEKTTEPSEDSLSYMDKKSVKSQKEQIAPVATFFQCYPCVPNGRNDIANVNYTHIFANWNSEDETKIYPVTIKELAKAQKSNRTLKPYFRKKGKSKQISV